MGHAKGWAHGVLLDRNASPAQERYSQSRGWWWRRMGTRPNLVCYDRTATSILVIGANVVANVPRPQEQKSYVIALTLAYSLFSRDMARHAVVSERLDLQVAVGADGFCDMGRLLLVSAAPFTNGVRDPAKSSGQLAAQR